uniref:Secreted protein n=1 Tax=Catharus ustulatus TaxID=91951 RepID=A0A8C3V1H7_CATUS
MFVWGRNACLFFTSSEAGTLLCLGGAPVQSRPCTIPASLPAELCSIPPRSSLARRCQTQGNHMAAWQTPADLFKLIVFQTKLVRCLLTFRFREHYITTKSVFLFLCPSLQAPV